jgi:ribosomal protein L22
MIIHANELREIKNKIENEKIEEDIKFINKLTEMYRKDAESIAYNMKCYIERGDFRTKEFEITRLEMSDDNAIRYGAMIYNHNTRKYEKNALSPSHKSDIILKLLSNAGYKVREYRDTINQKIIIFKISVSI